VDGPAFTLRHMFASDVGGRQGGGRWKCGSGNAGATTRGKLVEKPYG